ncbi:MULTISPECIES: hypothetical protein [Streptomyces]|uniref:hypothetical protein n=1 Tax=Streptomyces TaxID=1883 RepID=UPI001EFACED5|nr:hypothetical protein [Streptomyces sp. CL12-4]MCG8968992.1 hypothetical protein [Streptomyces sp. CL12-4]
MIYGEWRFGRDMCTLAIDMARQALQDEGLIPRGQAEAHDDEVHAKQGKLLWAEPIAQQMIEGKVRLRGAFADVENEGRCGSPPTPTAPAASTPPACWCTA